MQCPYCYIPFVDASAGNLPLWQSIIDKLAKYSPDIVTFGGGDPFAHKGFIQLLQYCQQFPFQVHVDTNTIKMPLDQMAEIQQLVNIIGVPLDGNQNQHDHLRNYSGHFDIVTKSLDALEEYMIPTKINTVYFPECKNQLPNIAKRLGTYSNIKQWFIYEYWHFDRINPQRSCSNTNHLYAELSNLRELSKVKDIHYSTVADRSPAYIFVSSVGNLYTIGDDMHTYIELANIFDNCADSILSTLQNTEQIQARAQLKQVVLNNET